MNILADVLIWGGYFAVFAWLTRKGRGHDSLLTGTVGFGVQALAYVSTYISAVALVGFGGLAHRHGLQLLLVAAGNVWLGTWMVYRFLAWPTKTWQQRLGARSPAQLIALGHNSPWLGRVLALIFAVFLGVYASAVIKGASLMLAEILPLPVWMLIWLVAAIVGLCVFIGGLRGVMYTEAMQGAVMLVGIILIVWAVLVKVGGPVDGVLALAELPPDRFATNGFLALSGGESGLFILSLVAVTSVAVWAQPQMIQRHFALSSPKQTAKSAPVAMLALTILVGGTYFIAALSRLILPEVASPDEVMPSLVRMLLPHVGVQIFVLAIVSASLSTATALYHIAASSLAEDVPGKPASSASWLFGILVCILVSGACAQIKGQLVALLCTTSWSVVGATALVPYLALVRTGKRHAPSAWLSALCGFFACLLWYLCVYKSTAIISPLFGAAGSIPPFFVGLAFAAMGWGLGLCIKSSTLEPADIRGDNA